MNLNDYQTEAMELAVFDDAIDWIYPVMKLSGEAGELLEKVQGHFILSEQYSDEDIAKEAGDVLWYVAYIATVCDLKLESFFDASAVYEKEINIIYRPRPIPSIMLSIKASQVCEYIGKVFRDQSGVIFQDDIDYVGNRLVEIFYYLGKVSERFNYSIREIAELNLRKLRDRQKRNVINGSGDNR